MFFRVLSVHILAGRVFFFSFFSCLSVMNPDGKKFLYVCCSAPHLPLVLIGGEAVLFISSVVYGGNDLPHRGAWRQL